MFATVCYQPITPFQFDTLRDGRLEKTDITIGKPRPTVLPSSPRADKVTLGDGYNSLEAWVDPNGIVRLFLVYIPQSRDAGAIIRTLGHACGVSIKPVNHHCPKWIITNDEIEELVDELLAYVRKDISLLELGWPQALWVPEANQLVHEDGSFLHPRNRNAFLEHFVVRFSDRLISPITTH